MIRRPVFRRDRQIAELEMRLRTMAEEYASLATDERFSFFWRNLTASFRNRGKLLPGNLWAERDASGVAKADSGAMRDGALGDPHARDDSDSPSE